ncbi:MAG: SagB/ThcOx family dehydrogenase [Candidatus Hodarchaeota archaeon]
MKSQRILFSIILAIFIFGLFFSSRNLLVTGFQHVKQLPEEIALPSPDIQGTMSLDEAFIRFKSVDSDFTSVSLPLNQLGQLLWSGQGISHAPFRTAPSAGGTYPLELFAVVGVEGVVGVTEGVYQYIPQTHRIHQLLNGDFRAEISDIVSPSEKSLIMSAPVSIIVLADYNRTTEKYGSRGIRYVHLEVGHVIQNICLQSTSLNLRTRASVAFNALELKESLETQYGPLALLPIGKSPNTTYLSSKEIVNSQKDSETLMSLNKNVFESSRRSKKSPITVEYAISQRKSQREYLNGSVALSQFSGLFRMCYGSRHPETGNRSFYSISNRFPVKLSVVVGEVAGLSPGIYQYQGHNHTFVKIRDGDFREELATASLDQEWVRTAQFSIVMTVDYELLDDLYGEEKEKITQFEGGMCAENFYLKTADLGLGMVVVGAFHDLQVNGLIESTFPDQPVYVIPVGLVSLIGDLPPSDASAQPLYYWGDFASFVALSIFYLTIFITTPIVRRKWKREARWLHYILSGVTAIFACVHITLILGYGTLIQNPFNFTTYYYLLRTALIIPYLPGYSLYDIGLIIARLAVFCSVLLFILILPILREPENRKIMFLHKCFTVTTVLFILIHAVFNGRIVALNPLLFLFLNSIAITGFLILRQEPEWLKTPRKIFRFSNNSPKTKT